MILHLVLGAIVALVVAWLVLVVVLLVARPRGPALGESARLLPDTVRLVARLARDPSLPRRVRGVLGVMLGYLALPIDLVPDFLPVIGYADDVIVVGLGLRFVVRRSGPAAVERHWPGTPDGLATLQRVCGLPPAPASGETPAPGTG